MTRQSNLVQLSFGEGLVRKSLARQVYESLERSILEGRIAPGMRLAEEAVAAVFSVSRGPTREAIMELERTGLAERNSSRDRRVTVPSEKFIRDTFDTWMLLESERIYVASLNSGAPIWKELDGMLARMTRLAKNGTPEQVKLLMTDFHSALHRDCSNAQLLRIASDFDMYIRWFRNLYYDYHADTEELALEEHQCIVESFKAKDRSGLLKVLQTHLAFHRDRVLTAWRATNAADLIDSGQALDFELRERAIG